MSQILGRFWNVAFILAILSAMTGAYRLLPICPALLGVGMIVEAAPVWDEREWFPARISLLMALAVTIGFSAWLAVQVVRT